MRKMLIDKKMCAGGLSMLIVGVVITVYLNTIMPVGQSGMTEEEIIDLIAMEEDNKNMNTLAGILIGIGFLLILISFGAKRKRKNSPEKVEKKPIA